MSDNRLNISGGMEYLRSMSTEELDELIRLVSLEDEIDVEFLDQLLTAAAEREPKSDVHAAYEEFQRVYSGQQEAYPVEDAGNGTQTKNICEYKKSRRLVRLRRVQIVAAVAVLILVANTVSAYAFGLDFLKSLARWTQDTFSFEYQVGLPQSTIDGVVYSSLEDALNAHGIIVPLAPTKIPNGFELIDLAVDYAPNNMVFYAHYQNGDKDLTIQILAFETSSDMNYEKDTEPVFVYERNGVDHYIMTNNIETKAVWTHENYECMISGDISTEELKQVINSIYGE